MSNRIAQGDVNIFSKLTSKTPRKHSLVIKETKNHGHRKDIASFIINIFALCLQQLGQLSRQSSRLVFRRSLVRTRQARLDFFFFLRVCFDLNADFGLQTCLRHHGQAYGLLELALLAVHGLRPRNAILAFPPF